MSFSSHFNQVRPAYEIPADNLVGEILVPAMRLCEELRIEAGFFSSRCLAQIAPGLAAFVNDTPGILQLMVSPEISEEDRDAIQRGVTDPQIVLEQALDKLFESARLSGSAIERHSLETLSFLVASGRLEMRVVLMARGMYHKKIWLFRSGEQWLAVHGSGNATERGLLVNGEQMSIDRAWVDGPRSAERVQMFVAQWAKRWQNHDAASLTVDVGRSLQLLRAHARLTPPTIDDFWEAWRRDHDAGLEPELPHGYTSEPVLHRLRVPEWLDWRSGVFAHQGPAVDALLQRSGGIVSIATGGGKTKTALIAATEIQGLHDGHLCVVILAPSRPLIRQWASEVRDFGMEPVVLTGMQPLERLQELDRLSIGFGTSQPRTEVLVMTNALFGQRGSIAREWLERLPDSVERVFIADEVHNLGSSTFIDNQPEFFEYRIGLSATPIRQYDPDGTHRLFDFFGGDPVFEFTLRDAINAGCLVPYRYYLHPVEFDSLEMDHYQDLTEQLARSGFSITDDGRTVGLSPRVERLLRERRALVEQASSKLYSLEQALSQMNPNSIQKTLIYTSAKPTVLGKPRQITAVNKLLQDLHITSHQYTAEETGTSKSPGFLRLFASGDYQVLTSMKVLDEGIDIPDTNTAFLMASSTVEREWVQRRGRILRRAPGKEFANLHDFIVIPPDTASPSSTSLLRSELRRASAFADLAENEYDPDGPRAVIRNLESSIVKV